MPVEVALGDGVRALFTTVDDGNLSGVVGDPEDARRARATLDADLGVGVRWVRQVHGSAVHVVHPDGDEQVAVDGVPEADAVLTTSPRVAVGVLVADCVPVLLADPGRRVVAAVHAGRVGLLGGVLTSALDAMVAAGARLDGVSAAIGPAACGRCYEVPAAMRDEAEARLPGVGATTSWGTPSLDLPAAVEGVLRARGLHVVPEGRGCTIEDARWFSHRATGAGRPGRLPGRSAGVVRLVD